jgi:hypothetical protein
MTNTNCLEEVRCPKCRNEDGFYIVAIVTLFVTDDGTEGRGGDHVWDDNSPCMCGNHDCEHKGTWSEFHIGNQEAARLRLASEDLLDAAELIVARWSQGDLADAVRQLDAAVAKAKGGEA